MVVISQGPLTVPDLIDKAWPVPVIHSTWKGQNYYEGAIYSEIPEFRGPQNVCLQQKSTLIGLEEAKRQGFKRALKFRSDMIPNNASFLLNSFKDGLNFLFWHDHAGGYLVDYCMAGRIEDLIDIWSFEDYNDFPERLLTNQ